MIKSKQSYGGQIYMHEFSEALRKNVSLQGGRMHVADGKACRRADVITSCIDPEDLKSYIAAAEAAAEMVASHEPEFLDGRSSEIIFNADLNGMMAKHDFRDILITRDNGLEIGVSFRPDMVAIRHPNLFDPGWEASSVFSWIGMGCTPDYLTEIGPVAELLRENEGKEWNEVFPTQQEKVSRIYAPVLDAFIDEIYRTMYLGAAGELTKFLFGADDYYQVTFFDKKQLSKIMAYNINGTLGAEGRNAVPVLDLPMELVEARYKEKSTGEISANIITIVFNGGWTIDLRLYMSTKKILEHSLKFSISLVGKPHGIFQEQMLWKRPGIMF